MASCTVTDLHIYPLKGAQGVACDEVEVRRSGIVGDRELMLVIDGEAVHQKDHTELARVRVELGDGNKRVFHHPEAGRLDHEVVRETPGAPAKLHYNDITVTDQGDEAAAWFGKALGVENVRLVSLPQPWDRWIPLPAFEAVDGKPQDSFYDAAPILLNNQSSLDDFNTRTDEPVPMNRFRANVVVSGGLEAYAEDDLSSLRGDAIDLLSVAPCERCVITTTDQTTGERPTKEPLKTLSTYRRVEEGKYGSGVLFGLYMTPREDCVLRVGDRLEIEN